MNAPKGSPELATVDPHELLMFFTENVRKHAKKIDMESLSDNNKIVLAFSLGTIVNELPTRYKLAASVNEKLAKTENLNDLSNQLKEFIVFSQMTSLTGILNEYLLCFTSIVNLSPESDDKKAAAIREAMKKVEQFTAVIKENIDQALEIERAKSQ